MLLNNTQTNGAKRYTYNTANLLTQVEAYNGSGWDVQAEMAYNGLNQRLSMDAAGVIAYYVMDTSTGLSASGNRPLTAESNGNTTSYLYGLGVVGEETNTWSYSLTDGTNTQRQLTDSTGEVTYSARYTPWGDTLDTYGTGNFAFGYFGGLMDNATGLLYVGNGQYYDPEIGRFLTRNPNTTNNPYLPFDPTGAIIGPLGILAVLLGRKKNKSKYDVLLFMLVFAVASGMALSACDPSDSTPSPAPSQPPTAPPSTPTPSPSPSPSPSPTAPPAPTNTPVTPCPPDFNFEQGLITFDSGWDPDEIEKVMQAIMKVGERLSPYISGGLPCLDAFLIAYRIQRGYPLTFITAQDIGNGECKAASRGVVKCGGNVKMDNPRWMVHEFGHLLQHSRYRDGSQGLYGSLENAQIVDNLGRWVTGKHPNGVFERTMLGYLSAKQPDVYHGPRYYEPAVGYSLGFETWNSNESNEARNEDVADMFLNWVYNSFDYSPDANGAGTKRYDWVELNVWAWVNNATY